VKEFPAVTVTPGVPVCFSSIVPALPPRRQQPNRFQFLIRLPEERNALLALVVLRVVCETVDVGVPEFLKGIRFGEH
jgi:hypothetical protein